MKILHNVEFKIGDSKLLLTFIAALILLFTVSCGGGGGGGGGGGAAVGGSSSPVVAVSFDGLSRSAAGGRSAVWTVAASIDLTIYIDDAVVLKTTVTQANSAVSVEDVTIGSKARATAVVHRTDGTTPNAVSDEIITVAGTNTLTLYIEYKCVLYDITPPETKTYTSKTGLNLPQRVPNALGLPHVAWKTADETRYPIGPVNLSGGSPGDLVLTPVYEYPAPVISFSGTPITEEITLCTGTGSAHSITVDANIDSVVWDGLGGIVSVANSGFSHTITASSVGSATITAANPSDLTKTTTCTIKVINGNWTIDAAGAISVDSSSVSGEVTIPEKLAGQTVTSIGARAFVNCLSLTSVSIPDTVTAIETSAFENCTVLTSVTIPDTVTSIGALAFRDCSSLRSVDIPDGVTEIGIQTFDGCTGLTSVSIPDGVTEIWTRAFQGCTGLESVDIPDSVTSIWPYAFYNCSSLTSVTIPASVVEIEDWAFYGCSALNMVTCLAINAPSLGSNAFPALGGGSRELICPFDNQTSYTSSSWGSYFSSITIP